MAMVDLYELAFARAMGGGGAPVPPAPPAKKSDVTLYDYDGTIVAGYTAAEFAEMTELPAPPEHELLTFTGWNYSLADAKAYVTKYGEISIGAVYRVTDGKTRIFITLVEGRLSPVLGLGVNGSVDVDWGDGTAHGTLTGSSETTAVFLPHTYATAGDYVIAITPGEGSTFGFVGDGFGWSLLLTKGENATTSESQIYQNAIKKVFVSNGGTSIGESAFGSCYSLANVIIPDSVTSIGSYAFGSCYSLANVIISDGVTSIGTYAFGSCYSLANVIISDGVTSIGESVFNDCHSLANVIIPDSVTSIGTYAFGSCHSLANVIISDGVTSIGESVFNYCHSLANVIIPDSVTSIGKRTFYFCYNLANVIIPDSVTSIGSYAFGSCCGLGFIKFESTTPPTISNVSAFSNVPTDCIIYVPAGYLEDYEDATNYPDPDVYQYTEY